jgi:hypothetical protein
MSWSRSRLVLISRGSNWTRGQSFVCDKGGMMNILQWLLQTDSNVVGLILRNQRVAMDYDAVADSRLPVLIAG